MIATGTQKIFHTIGNPNPQETVLTETTLRYINLITFKIMTKQPTRYEKVLSMLPNTLTWTYGIDIESIQEFLLLEDELPRIFLGSGGSLSAAMLASQLSVEQRIVAVAMTPYQYVCSSWSRLPAKVFLFSAGGRNIDALNAYKTAIENPFQHFGVMLMSSPSLLESKIQSEGKGKAFIFPLKNGDGFLATNSLLSFYSLLFRIYRNESVAVDNWDFVYEVEQSFKDFIGETYKLDTKSWDEHNAALYEARETDRFYVLYSPDTMPIAVDLESRFSEGSVGCLQISDYRNFAHGRFNWFHKRKGQTAIIAIVTPESEMVANNILKELPDYIPYMKLSTNQTASMGTMELLIKSMFLAKHLGTRWGLDIGAPEVADFGRKIHRLDFLNSDENSTV